MHVLQDLWALYQWPHDAGAEADQEAKPGQQHGQQQGVCCVHWPGGDWGRAHEQGQVMGFLGAPTQVS